MSSNYGDFQTQRNKVIAQAGEKAAGKAVLIGVDIFKAILNFLKQMLFAFLGK